MYNDSRKAIYDWLYDMFHGVVTNNVYEMSKPIELASSDNKDGFMVIRVGSMMDASEFHLYSYGMCRVYITCYVPLKSRGRVNWQKYELFENKVREIVSGMDVRTNSNYTVVHDSMLSMDDIDDDNADNQFAAYTRSFVVTIDGDN